MIKTKDAETSIKEAARHKCHDLYAEIKDLDLIAKEFRYHEQCRRDFVRPEKKSEQVRIYFLSSVSLAFN